MRTKRDWGRGKWNEKERACLNQGCAQMPSVCVPAPVPTPVATWHCPIMKHECHLRGTPSPSCHSTTATQLDWTELTDWLIDWLIDRSRHQTWLYVSNRWVSSQLCPTLDTFSPSTLEMICSIPRIASLMDCELTFCIFFFSVCLCVFVVFGVKEAKSTRRRCRENGKRGDGYSSLKLNNCVFYWPTSNKAFKVKWEKWKTQIGSGAFFTRAQRL